jgi:hypothetical protein
MFMLLSRHKNVILKSGHKNSKHVIWKLVAVQIRVIGDDSNKSKFDSGGNEVEIEFW